jgi:hypothetical protein
LRISGNAAVVRIMYRTEVCQSASSNSFLTAQGLASEGL